MQIDPAEPGKKGIEGARGAALEKPAFAAVQAQRLDHLVPLPPAADHFGKQRRRVLQVAIHGDHRVAARLLQAGHQRVLVAEVA
jgi:hypothetical protein